MLQKVDCPKTLATGAPVRLGSVENLDFELERGNRTLIWGWKRNNGAKWRAVYFGGDLGNVGGDLALTRGYLFYRSRGTERDVALLAEQFAQVVPPEGWPTALRRRSLGGDVAEIRFDMGFPEDADRDRVRRLQLRRPRKRLPDVTMPPAIAQGGAGDIGRFDIYIGSGLSYEAGLPTLCDMHDAFGVDTECGTAFTTGAEDPLPARLRTDMAGTLARFCAVHAGALSAPLTPAMERIAELHRAGIIGKVFTDNVDNMLAKAGIPFERTRGSGVFNEVYPAEFASDRLVVVGVAADRRSLVRQARARGLEIITVNPCQKVAPMVRHLDYIRPTDRFFARTAREFFA